MLGMGGCDAFVPSFAEKKKEKRYTIEFCERFGFHRIAQACAF
jgi:hypothetical protein